jgi:EAL domain-containing protein (putative c-di-GMP-specific phosphodiesterase class I)
VFLRDAAQARATLERLIALGCGVTLDDFGAGNASISFLCSQRFSAIKLERSLVKGAASGNAESVAMIRAAVAIADSLEMTTTAKGVECEEELDIAWSLGCRRLQGMAYGAAMSVQDLTTLFGNKDVAMVG